MHIPAFLRPGDTIGLVCTARKIERASLEPAIEAIKKRGFLVKIGASVGASFHQFAGDDAYRRKDLQNMMDDKDVQAILVCRGGYGTIRIIDDIYYGRFLQKPKWIIGYSDVTALHSHLNQVMGIATLHATMPVNFKENTPEAIQSLFDGIEGRELKYGLPPHKLNRMGQANGTLIGGNLSILYSLLGTKTVLNTARKILFIEDLDEYLYHIDRMMVSLKRAGKLQNLAALIVGGMTQMHDNEVPFGKTVEEIVLEHVAEYNYPVCFGFPSGHVLGNRAIRLGVNAHLEITENQVSFLQ